MEARTPIPHTSLAKTFYFEAFSLDIASGKASFTYRTDAGHTFTHELSLTVPDSIDTAALAPALFALGLAELPHYWKAILAPEIVVNAGALSTEQTAFWETLYTKGLGEFFYENRIDFRGLVNVRSGENAPTISATASQPQEKALVPLGGGKDSLVTGELLKKSGKPFSWFELEPLPFADALKQLSGVSETVAVGRDVAKNFAPILELVGKGAPNGHVPITATYIFSAVLAAKLNGYRDVILSLERSASEGNVEYLGMEVNHQYSKSYEFEQAASAYIQEYIDSSIRMFSLLRPLYELQIVEAFANYPQYFSTFVSCNRGLKSGSWCGQCAKCAFMFAALSAYLPSETVSGIFKKNLFEDESLIPLYRELIGEGEAKPFDCVGTFDENILALYLAGERYTKEGKQLPPVLAQLPLSKGAAHLSLLSERGTSIIPEDYL